MKPRSNCCALPTGLDPLTQLIARKIIEIYINGERDAPRICPRALKELGVPTAAVLGFLGLPFAHHPI